jgi:hypothetical protein
MSNNELMLALSGEVERNERYQAPPVLTRVGQLDRRHESEHALAIRDFERYAREGVAIAAVEAIRDVAWIQARGRVISETKFAIDRAQKESDIIAQGDPVKQAKFAILDDEFFNHARLRANKPTPNNGRGLFG